MSLINQVLKEVERREAGESPERRHRAAAGRKRNVPGAGRWPLWLLAAIGFGVILHLSLQQPGTTTRSDAAAGALTAQAAARPGTDAQETDSTRPPPAEAKSGDRARRGAAAETDVPTPAVAARGRAGSGEAAREPTPEPARQASSRAEQHAEEAVGAQEPAADSRPAPGEAGAEQEESGRERNESGPQKAEESTGDDGTRISIRRAQPAAPEANALAAAKRMLSRGEIQRSEARLRTLTEQRPELGEAHRLLASILIQRGRSQAAAAVLERGLDRADDPRPLAALLGRVLIQRGELARARELLERHRPPLAADPDYHLLLAAAYRQAGDDEQAAEHYRRLSEVLPRRGAVWIGLGASLEALERPRQALTAYNRALDGDDERAARFARQRIGALESLTGEPQ